MRLVSIGEREKAIMPGNDGLKNFESTKQHSETVSITIAYWGVALQRFLLSKLTKASLNFLSLSGNVPTKYSENTALGRWVGSQRSQYKLYQKGMKCTMTNERAERLTEIGFEWGVQRYTK